MKLIQDKITKRIERPNYRIRSKSDLLDKMETDYQQKNLNNLKYTIYNLLPLKDNTGRFPFRYENFLKYMSYNKTTNKLNIFDDTNSFLNQKYKSISSKYFTKMNYLDYKNRDKERVFITLTNPSKYHFYKTDKITKRLLHNTNRGFDTIGYTIEQSFKNMSIIKREYYKEVKKNLKRKGLDTDFDFVSVLENHKNMSVHNHSIFYVDKDQLEIFTKTLGNIIKRHKLKQCELKILHSSKGSSYLMKYLMKNDNDSFNQYKSFYSQYRFFTCSNIGKYTQETFDIVYKIMKSKSPELFQELDKDGNELPVLKVVENYIDNNLTVEYEYKVVENISYKEIFNEIDKKYNSYYLKDKYDCIDIWKIFGSSSGIFDKIENQLKEEYKNINDHINKIKVSYSQSKTVSKIIDKNSNEDIFTKKSYTTDLSILERLKIC